MWEFYEAACQVTQQGRESDVAFGHTSSERAPPLQPARGARANGSPSKRVAKHAMPRCLSSEVTHPFIRALLWHVTYRRRGGFERRSSALCGTALDSGHTPHTRLLLQLDDLTSTPRLRPPQLLTPSRPSTAFFEFGPADIRSGRATSRRVCARDVALRRPSPLSFLAGGQSPVPTCGKTPCADRRRATPARPLARVGTAHAGARCAQWALVAAFRLSCTPEARAQGSW